MTVFTPADRQKPIITTVWEQNQRKHLSFPSGSDKRYPTVTNNSAVKQKNRLSVTTVKTVVFFYQFDFYIVNENKLIWVNMWYTFNRIRQKEGNGCETAALLFWFIFLLLFSEPTSFSLLKTNGYIGAANPCKIQFLSQLWRTVLSFQNNMQTQTVIGQPCLQSTKWMVPKRLAFPFW